MIQYFKSKTVTYKTLESLNNNSGFQVNRNLEKYTTLRGAKWFIEGDSTVSIVLMVWDNGKYLPAFLHNVQLSV